jgi:cytochrome c oxidase subunit 2
MWFEATKEGEHNLFCTEYCGTKHSDMITKCIVVSPEKFLTELDKYDDPGLKTQAEWGKEQFAKFGCAQCHPVTGDKDAIGPRLNISGADHGFGSTRKLADGKDQVMDENYIRESILTPMAKVRAGFQPVMPPYQGRVKDKHINALIEYMKTLK